MQEKSKCQKITILSCGDGITTKGIEEQNDDETKDFIEDRADNDTSDFLKIVIFLHLVILFRNRNLHINQL